MPAAVSKVANLVQRLATPAIIESDAELLARFVKSRDEAAFATLVERHGPLVRGVCRRILGDVVAVDDVVQATFIALAKQASTIRRTNSLSAWLYGTAHRLTRNHRLREIGRRTREQRAAKPEVRDPDQAWQDLHAIFDEEIQKLPESLRGPILLCYFDGRTQDEAARQMGLSVPTLRRRLEKGRSLLKLRLERRGIAPALALTAFAMSREPIEAATARQIATTVLAAPTELCGAIHFTKTISGRFRAVSVAFLGITLVSGILISGARVGEPPPINLAPATIQPTENRQRPRADVDGVPLPDGALARVGLTRFQHGGPITSITFSPDGQTIISAGQPGGVALWDFATGKLKRRFDLAGPEGTDCHVRMLGDGTIVAVDNHACYRIEKNSVVATSIRAVPIPPGQPGVWSVSLSPDGKLFAFGGWDGVHVYDSTTGKRVWQQPVKGEAIRSMKFSNDGKMLAVAAFSPHAQIFEALTGRSIADLTGKQAEICPVAFSPDGKLLATQSADAKTRTLVVWDIAAKKEIIEVGDLSYWSLYIDFSPNGKLVAAEGGDGQVKIIDVREGKIVQSLQPWPIASVWSFSPNSELLTCATVEGFISIWEVNTGRLLKSSDPLGAIGEISFGEDGNNLVLHASDYSIRDWSSASSVRRLAPLGDAPWAAELSPDRKLLALASRGEVRVVDVNTNKERFRFATSSHTLRTAKFSPDNSRLFVAGDDKLIHVIDVSTGRLQWKLDGKHAIWVEELAITQDNRWLAAATANASAVNDFVIRLWDLKTGKEVRRFVPKYGSAFALAFSPDGATLAAVGGEPGHPNEIGSVVLWERETGTEIRSFIGHTERVHCVTFSPDGRMLATGGGDNTLRLWEVRTGIERRRIESHKNPVNAVAFSPDGRRLASASIEAPAYVWDVYSPPGAPAMSAADWWSNLQSGSAHLAAMGSMIANPEQAIAWCREKFKPSAKPDERKVSRLVDDLADPAYSVRDAAERELAKLGDSVESTLRPKLVSTTSAETASRLKKLLASITAPTPERMAALRAMEAIERIGTPEARKLMQEWAGGDPDNSFTRAAVQSLERMSGR